MNSKFIIIEGIDGCGKGVAFDGVINYLKEAKISFLDLRKKEADLSKEPSLLNDVQCILTCEPTFHNTGRQLREDILTKLPEHSAKYVAEKFAEDRKELYQKIVVPALEKELFVFQDRSIISSLVYQAVQANDNRERLGVNDIASLPGNILALHHAPGLVVVQEIDPEIAYRRLYKREKKDNSDFEKEDFLRKIDDRYKKGQWRLFLKSKGTEIVDLDCDSLITPEMTRQGVLKEISDYIKRNKLKFRG